MVSSVSKISKAPLPPSSSPATTQQVPLTTSSFPSHIEHRLTSPVPQTAATVMLLILYLMQNPIVQQAAQAEVDRVTSHGARLPTFDDAASLPYLRLILAETYRMNPLSPLGIPHASVEEDVYEGMRIPAGTSVFPNVWAMMHDEEVYHEPERFWPERYLPRNEGGRGEPLPVGNFGFGRR